ncbi:unnamed protein product, partial [Didymodactylos carnosus]
SSNTLSTNEPQSSDYIAINSTETSALSETEASRSSTLTESSAATILETSQISTKQTHVTLEPETEYPTSQIISSSAFPTIEYTKEESSTRTTTAFTVIIMPSSLVSETNTIDQSQATLSSLINITTIQSTISQQISETPSTPVTENFLQSSTLAPISISSEYGSTGM